MRWFVADLHVHTLLSPCAAVEMTPRNIVRHADAYGIDIVAITDHNACDNVTAALKAAEETNVTILPGMEVETKEEVHLIVLFDKMRTLRQWESIVKLHRQPLINDEARFGAQFVVDAEDNWLYSKQELLLSSLTMSLAEVTTEVTALGGLVIASHIDRPTYSIVSQLGFIPPELKLAAVEVSGRVKPQAAVSLIPSIGSLPVVTASDAHAVDEFITGPKTSFYIQEPTLAEIGLALAGQNLRKVVVGSKPSIVSPTKIVHKEE